MTVKHPYCEKRNQFAPAALIPPSAPKETQIQKYQVDLLYFQIIIDEDDKFLKLLELLGIYQEQGGMLHN